MRVAIMQPYLFPYLGYFQLIRAVDVFVLLDDVQYINKGWINRNNWLVNKQKTLFTFSLKKDSSYSLINERFFADTHQKEIDNFLETFKRSYGASPQFEILRNAIENSLDDMHVVTAIQKSIHNISEILGIETPIRKSSELDPMPTLTGQDRIIHLVETLNGTHYINPPGGVDLYDEETFTENNLELSFIKPVLLPYPQKSSEFLPGLSIIDVFANVSKVEIPQYLNAFSIVKRGDLENI